MTCRYCSVRRVLWSKVSTVNSVVPCHSSLDLARWALVKSGRTRHWTAGNVHPASPGRSTRHLSCLGIGNCGSMMHSVEFMGLPTSKGGDCNLAARREVQLRMPAPAPT